MFMFESLCLCNMDVCVRERGGEAPLSLHGKFRSTTTSTPLKFQSTFILFLLKVNASTRVILYSFPFLPILAAADSEVTSQVDKPKEIAFLFGPACTNLYFLSSPFHCFFNNLHKVNLFSLTML